MGTAVLRECFPKSVVLGPIDRPLRPTTDCNLRDVSEPDAGISGSACLCSTSFCNKKQELQTITGVAPQKTQIITNEVEDPIIEQKIERKPEPPRKLPSKKNKLSTRRKTACPRGFDLIGGGCYKIS